MWSHTAKALEVCKEAHFSNRKSAFGSAELKSGQGEKTPRSSVAPILGEGKHPMEEEKPVAPEEKTIRSCHKGLVT